jgi:hypothetical protein
MGCSHPPHFTSRATIADTNLDACHYKPFHQIIYIIHTYRFADLRVGHLKWFRAGTVTPSAFIQSAPKNSSLEPNTAHLLKWYAQLTAMEDCSGTHSTRSIDVGRSRPIKKHLDGFAGAAAGKRKFLGECHAKKASSGRPTCISTPTIACK